MKVAEKKVKRILFISLTNIGDIVLTTPVVGVLRERFPGARIDVIVGPNGSEIFHKNPGIFKVVEYNKYVPLLAKKRIVRKLRRVGYDLIVDLRNSMFPLLIGSKYRTSPIQGVSKRLHHKKSQHLRKLDSLGLRVGDAPFYLHVPRVDREDVARMMSSLETGEPVVAVAPGAKSSIKRWHTAGFAEVIKRLIEEAKAKVILVGDSQDKSIARDIKLFLGTDITDLCGRTSLCQLAAVVEGTDLLITNDSAPLHIAGAVGTDVLAIFGPTDPREYGPTGPGDRVIRAGLKCSPCNRAQCLHNHECMKNITPDEVFTAARDMLKKGKKPEKAI